jgi:hypothetical protein
MMMPAEHAFAYVLLEARRFACGTLARACARIRAKLLKIGAQVCRSMHWIEILSASACPSPAPLFQSAPCRPGETTRHTGARLRP